MQTKQRSFAAGEIAEDYHWHDDYRVFQTGLARCRGFVVRPGGGLTRKPPTEYLCEAYADSILIPMAIRANDAFGIELGGHGFARFYRNGARLLNGSTIYEVAHPYTAADLPKVRWTRTGDDLYLTHPARGMRRLSRLGNVNWTSTKLTFKKRPFADENTDEAKTLKASGAIGNAITLTASGWAFTPDMVGEQLQLRDGDQRVIAAWTSGEAGIGTNQLRISNGRVYQQVGPTSDGGPNPPTHTNGTRKAGASSCLWKFIRAEYGLVEITAVANATTATAKVLVRVPEEFNNDFNANYDGDAKSHRWAQEAFSQGNGWPEQFIIWQQRLFAVRGNRFWYSRTGDYNDFEKGATPDAAGSELLGADTGMADDIRWLSAGRTLMIGTTGEEHSIEAGSLGEGASAANMRIEQATSDGSNGAAVVRANGATLHISTDERSLMEIIYDFQINAFDSDDIALPSYHMARRGLKQMVWQKSPLRIIWLRDGAGQLIGHTYNPKQELRAWHSHPAKDVVIRDMMVVPGADGKMDDVYFRVERTAGTVTKTFIERLLPPFIRGTDTDPTLKPYLDCQISGTGDDITVIQGLTHLVGFTVQVVSNRGLEGDPVEVCADGCITLEETSVCRTRVTIGIPVRAQMRTLPIAAGMNDGSGAGRLKNISAMHVRALGCGTVLAGDIGLDHDLAEAMFDGADLPGQRLTLRPAKGPIPVTEHWDRDGQIDIWTDDPWPLEISGIDLVADIGSK